MPTMSTLSITAIYNSPLPAPSDTKAFTIATSVSPATETSPQVSQTAHVASVREAVAKLQDEVNRYLTERMEEEKEKGFVDAAKEVEEEEYGEEGGEEEE